MSGECLHTFDDGTQCPHVGWCPIHGDVDRYEPPATPMGLMTSETLAKSDEGWECGYRAAIADLQAGYVYGDMPDWRADGVEWLSGRLTERRNGSSGADA